MKKKVKTIITSTTLGIFLYSYLHFSENGKLPAIVENSPILLIILLISNLTGLCVYYFNAYLTSFNFLKRRNFVRILSGIILNYLLVIILCRLILRLYVFGLTIQTYSEFYANHASAILRFYILAFVFIFLFVLVDFFIRSYQQFVQAKILAVKIAREQGELQLDAFKQQLSPHYLFNNLNTLSHLIYQDPHTTEDYIRNLSKTYDYIIKNSKLDLVPLREELDFINAYAYLLNIRFQDSLNISTEIIEAGSSSMLPPLSLQLLVENAIKHNIASPQQKLIVEIKKLNGYIEVKNNLQKKSLVQHSLKIGLNNLKKRYSFFTDMPIKITENQYYTIGIPLVKTHGSI